MYKLKKTVFIISNGVINNLDFLEEKLREGNKPVIICADGATRYIRLLNKVPDVIIGDMDSIAEDTLQYFKSKGSNVLSHPRNKDSTDTQLALEYALKMAPDQIVIVGALGGRIDHTLANISLLVLGVENRVETKIIDETSEVFVVNDSCVIKGEKGETVSLLPLSSEVTGIELQGFEYPLSNGEMSIGNPYGVSNRLIQKTGVISVKSGYLIVVRNYKV